MSFWGQFIPLKSMIKLTMTGPAEHFVEVRGGGSTGKEKLEDSERSVNRRGVQGTAVEPLAGVQGAEPPEAQRF